MHSVADLMLERGERCDTPKANSRGACKMHRYSIVVEGARGGGMPSTFGGLDLRKRIRFED